MPEVAHPGKQHRQPRLVRRREWQVGAVLVGIAAGYLPWLAFSGRTVFQFYTIAFEPYLLLGLAGGYLWRGSDGPPSESDLAAVAV